MSVSSCDAIVIGSGFGGAVTAARLAGTGRRVVVLERGLWPQHAGRLRVRNIRCGFSRWSRNIVVDRRGMWELHTFGGLVAVTSSAVGGGSNVYAGVQMQPVPSYFEAFIPELSAAELDGCFRRVRAAMQSSPARERPRRGEVFERLARVADPGVIESPPLAGKRLHETYVELALRNGAELRTFAEVVGLARVGTRYEVRWFDHGCARHHVAQAAEVVLAAGTLGTLRLLFGARDRDRTLPAISRTLGRGFSPNGDFVTLLLHSPLFDDADRPPFGSVAVRGAHPRQPTVAEMGFPVRALRRSAGLLGMGQLAATGVVAFDGRELRTDVDRALDRGFFSDLAQLHRRLAAGYRPRYILVNVPFGPRSRRLLTVHPVGGAAIGDSVATGVVDHAGRVFGYPGLRIADGAMLPAAPGVPPALTIAALAEWQADVLAHEG